MPRYVNNHLLGKYLKKIPELIFGERGNNYSAYWILQTLYASIKETAKDKGALRRVLMSRAGADMDEISRFFKKKYGMELTEAIRESIPSGDYRDILIALAANS